ncbi:SipW-dependent-type signal peptide-containing protein [Dietzia sp. NPDC055877]
MDASTPMPADLQRQQDRKRKRKAILAGGVVLGLGAAVTLAAWSDDVFAQGTFGTGGNFALQGATDTLDTAIDSKNWAPYGTAAGAAVLSFAANMAPGETIYAPFSIRTTSETTLNGTLTSVSAFTDTGLLAPYLSYTIDQDATTCTSDGTGNDGTRWATGTSVSTAEADAVLAGSAPTVSAAAADEVKLCIAVSLEDSQASRDVINNNTSTDVDTVITWDFLGEQN